MFGICSDLKLRESTLSSTSSPQSQNTDDNRAIGLVTTS